MNIYPNLQKIRARMQLLNVTPHSIIEDGSYNIYTLRGESSLGNPYEYDISFISPMSLAVEEMVDTDVYILLEDEKNPIERREIYGKIFSAKEESMIADKFVYRLHIVHPLFYLGTTKRYEIYQEMTVVDIIQKVVLSYAGVLNVEFASHVPPGPIREYTTQYEQSDLAFIQMLCQEEGITLNLQGNQPNFSVVLDNINDSYLKLPLPLECHYNESKTFRVSHMQQDYYDFRSPSLEYSNSAGSSALSQTLPDNPKSAQLRNDLKHYKLRDRLEAARSSDSKRYTQQNSLHNYSNAEIIYGSSESLLTCDGYGGILDEIKTINQTEAIITKVAYDGFFPNALEEHNEEIDAQRPWQFSTTFEAIPMTTVFIPPVTVTKPRVYSTVTARVSGGQSAEALGSGENTIDIDTLGRIRVIFHFDPNYPTSCYIRFTNFSAGNGWGAQFIPRVNTEVVVSFLNGDPDRPIAIGSLYNGENKIPESLPANKTKSYIKTQSLPGGPDQFNLLSFEDKGGSELVHMKAQKDHLLHVLHDSDNYIDHDERTVIGNNRTELVKHDETIVIDHNRIETVHNDEMIRIDNNRTENVGNNETISIENNRMESVGSNESVSIGKNRSKNVGASENINIGANHSINIGGHQKEIVAKTKMETIGLLKALSVGGAYQVTVGAASNMTTGLSSSEQVGINKSIIAGSRCEITVGSSSLIMNADGTIIIKGTELKLEGAKHVEINGKVIDLN